MTRNICEKKNTRMFAGAKFWNKLNEKVVHRSTNGIPTSGTSLWVYLNVTRNNSWEINWRDNNIYIYKSYKYKFKKSRSFSRKILFFDVHAEKIDIPFAMLRTSFTKGGTVTPCVKTFSHARLFSTTHTTLFQGPIKIQKTKNFKSKTPYSELQFGKEFTDHWLRVEWKKAEGWSAPKITPYSKLSLDPSALVLHYAIECFEGMKAYKDSHGKIRLFRPEENMKRMNTSAQRLQMPNFPEDKFLDAIKQLLILDKEWIPNERGYSLYVRPTMIATEALLGVHPPAEVLLYVILSPVGPYYPTGFKPVALYADSPEVRAWPGGTGCYKIGANYAPGILPALQAAQKGYQQILWLQDKKITEVGTMNLFWFWKNKQGKNELITPPLDGQILPGITRKSIIELCKEWNEFTVTEAECSIDTLLEALQEGRIIEMFGAGTAAVVSPVNKIFYGGKDYAVPCKNNTAGELTTRLMNTILSIQYGEQPSPWSVLVD